MQETLGSFPTLDYLRPCLRTSSQTGTRGPWALRGFSPFDSVSGFYTPSPGLFTELDNSPLDLQSLSHSCPNHTRGRTKLCEKKDHFSSPPCLLLSSIFSKDQKRAQTKLIYRPLDRTLELILGHRGKGEGSARRNQRIPEDLVPPAD